MTANEKEISVIAGASFFLLAGVIFVLPAVRDHAPDQTKESATEETESETPTETETESETENRRND